VRAPKEAKKSGRSLIFSLVANEGKLRKIGTGKDLGQVDIVGLLISSQVWVTILQKFLAFKSL
jgi:hypothetical protein